MGQRAQDDRSRKARNDRSGNRSRRRSPPRRAPSTATTRENATEAQQTERPFALVSGFFARPLPKTLAKGVTLATLAKGVELATLPKGEAGDLAQG